MEKIHPSNLLPLELIANNLLKKRIKREISMLQDTQTSIYMYIDKGSDLPVIIIVDEKYKNNNIYSIILDKNYPFVVPTVKINFKLYLDFLKLNNTSLQILKKIHYNDCLCCSSILCANNWAPCYSINNILLEIRKNKSYKRDIIYKIIINIIKNKYLIEDINLDDWIFTN